MKVQLAQMDHDYLPSISLSQIPIACQKHTHGMFYFTLIVTFSVHIYVFRMSANDTSMWRIAVVNRRDDRPSICSKITKSSVLQSE